MERKGEEKNIKGERETGEKEHKKGPGGEKTPYEPDRNKLRKAKEFALRAKREER